MMQRFGGVERAYLQYHKFAPAFVADLEEGVACHVLHARVCLMHKLKELVDHCFEELPVCTQELGILPYYVPA